ncbi:MAG TPA: Nudix family hydrolase [Rudaea sp.]|uniref:Nudix family hydrolase n=1 Tax=Rudaea sp. TaxID=2136325 RepID=UPI002F92305A
MIHVVAGILIDPQGRVLVTQRPHGKHLAGAWEFPGGKIEPGETAPAALRRELREELGVEIGAIEPLIGVPWQYPQKSIFLDAYQVLDYSGTPQGREGQALDWRSADDLRGLNMPPPDRPIVSALRLPPFYAITPEPGDDDAAFLERIDQTLASGASLLQLRAKHLSRDRLRALARETQARAGASGARVLLNGNLDIALELGLDGVHLPAAELLQLKERPIGRERWLAGSCHDAHELAHAAAIGVDFVVLGAVRATQSHPESAPLGWTSFAELCAAAPLPVYALGGLAREDLDAARAAGAQGIAGISGFLAVP